MSSSRLLSKSLLFCLIMTILIIISYFYIDRSLALWVHQHIQPNLFYNIAIKIPPALYLISGISLIVLVLYSSIKPLKNWQKTLIIAGISQYCAMGLKVGMKYFFGRYTPEVYLSQHLYGFNFFHEGMQYYSFPSGHTTATLSYLTVIWLRCKSLRSFSIALSVCVAISLIALNMHYLSDIFAGIMLGVMVALFSNKLIFNEKRSCC